MKRLPAILLIAFIGWNCSDVANDETTPTERQYPDQEIWNSAITLTKDGKKRAIVHSAHLTKYNDRAFINMDTDVAVDFYNEEERHLSHLTSQTATVNENTNDLFAKGNVVVVSDSGLTLLTEEMRWDHRKERILSEVFVTFVTPEDSLTGVGFESDSDLKNWVIFKPSGVTNREMKY
ncbi:MAG: LPS export ABC transporter periplasmic protein LptC [Candidatus Neomarinimicrobiota bacterium]